MSTPKIIGTSHSIVQRDGQTYDQIIVWLHDHHRANAFGAIRRAAAVARECDRRKQWSAASAARDAIRAAIGSEKA